MSLSQLKFLLDENVKRGLLEFLKQKGIDVVFKPKGVSNGKLAGFSVSEQRILVTNDEDFVEFTKEELFSLILLKIPQDKPEVLLESFSRLIKEKTKPEDFEGKLFILKEQGFEISTLPLTK